MEENENKELDLFQEIDVQFREQHLRDNCYKTQFEVVTRPYSEEELAGFKEELAEASIRLNELRAELNRIKKEMDAKIKPLKIVVDENVNKLKNKFEENEEEVFLLDDQFEGLMKIYDKLGKFLYSRKLFPNERQQKIFSMSNNLASNS